MTDTKDTKPEIHTIRATINLPCTRFPHGRNSLCSFIHVGDVVALCHPESGVPVQDPNGKEYKFTLPPGSTFVDARIHAARLTKDFPACTRHHRTKDFHGPSNIQRMAGSYEAIHFVVFNPQRARQRLVGSY